MAVALAGGGLIYQQVDNGTPAAGTANLWIDTNGGTCTRQATAAAYVDAAACSSFDTAYQAASLGDTVLVRSGAYGSQTITDDGSKDSTGDLADVTIEAETPGSVTIQDLQMGTDVAATDGPDHITIRHVYDNNTAGGGACEWVFKAVDINDITLDDVRMCNAYINIHDGTVSGIGHGFTITNSEFTGCTMPANDSDCGPGNIKIDAAADFTFENNYVHDMHTTDPGTYHLECMFVSRLETGMIEGNTFENCDVFDIFLQHGGPVSSSSSISDLTIQNNFFDCARTDVGGCRSATLAFSPAGVAFADILIRFNSFNAGGGISVNDDGGSTTYSNFRIIGNVLGDTSCYASATYDSNLYVGGSTCGTNSASATASDIYVDANTLDAGGDYHLKSGTNDAVGFVTPTSSDYLLTNDVDGDTRSAPRDAGADER